jgi:DNA helicase-2/ATP-dependent DNA helicase PcrA
MESDPILAGLNEEQRRAVETVRGPVCILAGAGSGKTTTITHRIAYQVATGTFAATQILAVTFTDKAAGELRSRLAALGVSGVPARTFHAAALAQLSALAASPPGDVLPSKALLLRQIGNTLRRPFRFRAAGDLAGEVEWAKNRRLTPATYLDGLGDHEPPLPPDVMQRVFREYERRKSAAARVDFEDLLEHAIRMYEDDASARERFAARYRAFTVDEYQDVNVLQETLLDRWLDGRDDVCAVGDDYQAIYGFTGASPAHLLSLPKRFPHAAVIRLEANYRSTPQILEVANRLTPSLGGAEKTLRATVADGPDAVMRSFASPLDEIDFVVEQIDLLHRDGVPFEEMAVLYRVNARSEDYEEALASRRVPFQVRAGAFLERPAARRLLAELARSPSAPARDAVGAAARRHGLVDAPVEGLGEQETTRQADLARLVALAREFDAGEGTAAEFAADLRARFGEAGTGRGVHLLTYHRAKGLEFEAVFLPQLVDGELPWRQAKAPEALAEERRLLYVGITRAKRHVSLTFAGGKPSRFLRELGLTSRERPVSSDDPLFEALRAWRRRRAAADGVPAYVVFHDRTLGEIARRRPSSARELASVPGVGETKLERYGGEVLSVVGS